VRAIRWLKSWGVLLVAVIALGLSGYAIYVDNVHYQEITKPHTQHDEIYNRLVRLDDKIERAEQSISDLQGAGQDINDSQENLSEAIKLRERAERAWDKGDYTKADRLIEEAYDSLEKIVTIQAAMQMWMIMAIIAAALLTIGILGGISTTKRKR
jgi:hypothetical protein